MALLVWDVSYAPCVQGRSQSRPKHTFKLLHLHVLRPGSLSIRNKVQHTAAVLHICVMSSHRAVTGDRGLHLLSLCPFSDDVE